MTGGWLDKTDNPGMAEWNLRADDVYGAVALVRFTERSNKMGITTDHTQLHPVTDSLANLGALCRAISSA
jgi:hypothetical protein